MVKLYFQIIKYDEQQSYLYATRRKRSRSFVQGFLKLHYAWTQEGSIDITDITGSNVSVSTGTSWARAMCSVSTGRGGAATADWGAFESRSLAAADVGIVVGTGTTAVTPQDYQLATKIADGVSSGTIEHLPCGGTTFVTSSTDGSFTLDRLFRNSSGGTLTVNEVGVYGLADAADSTAPKSFCLIRDLVSPGFAVNNGEYMRIIYTVSVTA